MAGVSSASDSSRDGYRVSVVGGKGTLCGVLFLVRFSEGGGGRTTTFGTGL